MPDAKVTEAALPARLLLIGGRGELSERLAAPLTAELAAAPILVELTTGRPALELLKSSPFDGLVADLEALSDVAEQLQDRIARLARAAAGALIVVLTGDGSISLSLAAMQAGAHDCVDRDLDGAALATRIGELARRHGKTRICLRNGSAAAEPAAQASIPVMRDLVLPMWRQEQRIIENAIQSFAGNIALAAAALELSPSTIYRKRQAWAEGDAKRA